MLHLLETRIVLSVEDLNKFSISEIGKETEINSLFPQRTNVQIAEVIDDSTIKVKVWEGEVDNNGLWIISLRSCIFCKD